MRGTVSAVLVATAVALSLSACASDPDREVAIPPVDASAEEVVRAYVDALDAHDVHTVRELRTADTAEHSWSDGVDSITHLNIGTAAPEKPQWTGNAPSTQVVRVPVDFTVEANAASLEDGRMTWGYLLLRTSETEPWRIFDEDVA